MLLGQKYFFYEYSEQQAVAVGPYSIKGLPVAKHFPEVYSGGSESRMLVSSEEIEHGLCCYSVPDP
jgi:hypothetical protein